MSFCRFLLSIAAPFALPVAVQAQAGSFDISGSMRLRYEGIANQPRVGFDRNDDLVNLRTTLMVKYDTGPVTLAAELWDSRVYLDDAGTPVTTGEVNTLELVQAYVATDLALGREATAIVKAGRFALNTGSRRLFAADDYRNTTNGYTGVDAEIASDGGIRASLIYVLPQQRRPDAPSELRKNMVAPDREGFDLVLWGGTVARAKTIGAATLEASFYHLGERDRPGRPTRDRSLNTYGGRVIREPAAAHADVEVEAFYQSGSISGSSAATAAVLPVSAWFIHGDVGYTFAGRWKPRISVEYDRASGDRAGGSYGRFDTLFGMRRADLSPSGLLSAVGRANLSTPGVRAEVAPSKRVDAFVSYHALWAAERSDAFSTTGVRDATGRSGAFAGHQFDARLRWWIRADKLRFEADGVVLTKGRLLRDAPNAPAGGTTLYGSLNLTATF